VTSRPSLPASRLPAPFGELGPEATRALLEAAPEEALEAGAWIRAESSTVREAVLLFDGEAELRRDGRLLAIAAAPVTLALPSLLRPGQPGPGLRAVTPVKLARLSLEGWERLQLASRGLYASVAQHLCDALAALEDDSLASLRGLDDVYLAPPGARLPPGPYAMEDVDLALLVMRGVADRLAGLLPSGLLPVPWVGDRYLVLIADIARARFRDSLHAGVFRYREATPLVPCLTPTGRFGAFAPEVYLDAYHAILLGREIYGFPKRHARVWIRDTGADVALGQEVALRVRWDEKEPLDAETFGDEFLRALAPAGAPATWLGRGFGAALAWAERDPAGRLPAFRIFVRKRIPAADAPESPALDQLVEIPFAMSQLGGFARLVSPTLAIAPDHAVLHGSLVGALGARIGFGLDRARIVRSYVSDPAPARRGLEGLLRRALRSPGGAGG
jgi:hypothetical protein